MKYIVFAAVLFASLSASADFTSVCHVDPNNLYCKAVGKRAYNDYGPSAVREIYIGPITGVAYKKKGGLISRPENDQIMVSPRDGYYYIIGPGGVADYIFLRDVREIAPK